MRSLPPPYAALLFIGVLGALLLSIVVPVWNQHTATEKRLATLKKQADAISRQAGYLMHMMQSSGKTAPRQVSTLFAEVESLAGRLGILEKIVSMKPTTVEEQGRTYERVSIIASGLYQQKGVALLHALEKEQRRIRIEQMTIRLSKERLWEISLTVRRGS